MEAKSALIIITSLILALLLVTLVTFYNFQKVLQENSVQIRSVIQSVSATREIESILIRHNRQSFLHLTKKNPAHAMKRSQRKVDLDNVLIKTSTLLTKKRDLQLFENIKQSLNKYFSKIKTFENNNTLSPMTIYLKLSPFIDQCIADIEKLEATRLLHGQYLQHKIDVQYERTKKYGMAIVVFFIGMNFIVLFVVYKFGLLPINYIHRLIMAYGNGKPIVKQTQPPKAFSEFEDIIDSFHTMSDFIKTRKEQELQFIATIAHDLRNPLNSIGLSSQYLKENFKDINKEDATELLEIIVKQTKFLEYLTSDLIDTARIESNQFIINLNDVDLVNLIRDSLNLYRSSSNAHKLNYIGIFNSKIYKCDPVRMAQVLNNLVSNAIKYSPMGGEVKVDLKEVGDKLEITITDQGIGIDPKEVESIFIPFKRSKNTSDKILGIGLGLSASRKIIEEHEGKIFAENLESGGAKISVILPQN